MDGFFIGLPKYLYHNIGSSCIKFALNRIFLLGAGSGDRIDNDIGQFFKHLLSDLEMLVFWSVDEHNKQVAGFQLVDLVKFK